MGTPIGISTAFCRVARFIAALHLAPWRDARRILSRQAWCRIGQGGPQASRSSSSLQRGCGAATSWRSPGLARVARRASLRRPCRRRSRGPLPTRRGSSGPARPSAPAEALHPGSRLSRAGEHAHGGWMIGTEGGAAAQIGRSGLLRPRPRERRLGSRARRGGPRDHDVITEYVR